ncbi:hypothetical protein AALB47_06050 [Lachnospiraceae bacterium 54-11]
MKAGGWQRKKKRWLWKKQGEEGVLLMKALLGLGDLVTNVNIPNQGQIGNLPVGAAVETNAWFGRNQVCPVYAGNLPDDILIW